MRIHRFLVALLVLGLMGLTSCGNEKISEAQAQDVTVAQTPKPDQPAISADTVNARIAGVMKGRAGTIRDSIAQDALHTVAATERVLRRLYEGKTKDAENQLYTLIGKMETLITANPDLGLIPVDVKVRVVDLISDINAINQIAKDAKAAVKKGYYQDARRILSQLASEEIISTYYIPLATYPAGLKAAAALIKAGKVEEAKSALVELLGTVAIQETVFPRPVLLAEQYVLEASKQNLDDDKQRQEAMLLLDNADYQLKLADALGYGRKSKDFASLAAEIKELKRIIRVKERNEKIVASFNSLSDHLKVFRKSFGNKPQSKQ